MTLAVEVVKWVIIGLIVMVAVQQMLPIYKDFKKKWKDGKE